MNALLIGGTVFIIFSFHDRRNDGPTHCGLIGKHIA